MEQFALKTAIYFGAQPLSALEQLDGKGVFLVTDRFLADSGLLERVTERLTGAVTVFAEVTPDPSLELAARGVAAFHASGAEVILAFGGGSPMDCAKAVRYFSRSACPLWCVPTTAGTGSEVTSFAILTDTQKGVKHALVDDALLPQAAILDAGFLENIPPKVTADTGMDVLCHAAEAYVARGADSFSDALAEGAFTAAFSHLSAACKGDAGAKKTMLEASCMAGMAFNSAGLGACHALAHAIGGAHHMAHGCINAILLPAVMDWHSEALPAVREKYGRLAGLCGLAPNARSLTGALRRLARSIGQPERFPVKLDAGAITAVALEDRCLPGDPAQVTQAGLKAVLERLR